MTTIQLKANEDLILFLKSDRDSAALPPWKRGVLEISALATNTEPRTRAVNKFSCRATNLKATIDGVEYSWGGGFGAVLKSYERCVKRGETRYIAGVVFYAYAVSSSGWLREVSWCPTIQFDEFDADWLRDLRLAIFCGH